MVIEKFIKENFRKFITVTPMWEQEEASQQLLAIGSLSTFYRNSENTFEEIEAWRYNQLPNIQNDQNVKLRFESP
jgi:hypothetical protein